MISRTPSGSLIGVTHSDTEAWLAADADVLACWPNATGYTYITAFEGWPDWKGPNVAMLWEVFGEGCPGPRDDGEVRQWFQIDGAVKRAQHVFLLPDVLDMQPLLIYRCIDVPDQSMVKTAVQRAQQVRTAVSAKRQSRDEMFGDRPFDQERDS